MYACMYIRMYVDWDTCISEERCRPLSLDNTSVACRKERICCFFTSCIIPIMYTFIMSVHNNNVEKGFQCQHGGDLNLRRSVRKSDAMTTVPTTLSGRTYSLPFIGVLTIDRTLKCQTR
jgi:hypothetical protein